MRWFRPPPPRFDFILRIFDDEVAENEHAYPLSSSLKEEKQVTHTNTHHEEDDEFVLEKRREEGMLDTT